MYQRPLRFSTLRFAGFTKPDCCKLLQSACNNLLLPQQIRNTVVTNGSASAGALGCHNAPRLALDRRELRCKLYCRGPTLSIPTQLACDSPGGRDRSDCENTRGRWPGLAAAPG